MLYVYIYYLFWKKLIFEFHDIYDVPYVVLKYMKISLISYFYMNLYCLEFKAHLDDDRNSQERVRIVFN